MIKHSSLLFALPLLLVQPALAQDIFGSFQDMLDQLSPDAQAAPERAKAPLPRPRPAEVEPDQAAEVDTPLPRPRPEQVKPETVVAAPVAEDAAPAEADERVYQTACPAVIQGLVEAEALPPLSEGACGERSPLKVTGVMSRGRMVPLSSPITTTCAMASALPDWVASVDGYAVAALGSPLAEVVTGTSYMCRKRNNAREGFTSEHGFANAVDVTGFTLEDGRAIDVTANWLPAAEPEGRLLRLAHDAACAGFTTTLGPEANAEHHDHLHLDLGCHGKSCTAQICE